MRLLNMQPGSLYNLLHPIVYSYEQAVARGQGRQWIADCFEIKQQQSRPSLMLPRCGVVSTTFFLSLLGMHKKLNKRSLYAGRDLAISKFNKKASKQQQKIEEKKKRSKLTPQQRLLANSTGFVSNNQLLHVRDCIVPNTQKNNTQKNKTMDAESEEDNPPKRQKTRNVRKEILQLQQAASKTESEWL